MAIFNNWLANFLKRNKQLSKVSMNGLAPSPTEN